MINIDDLMCPPIVGETYLVNSYECYDEKLFGSKFVPVLGPFHDDVPDTSKSAKEAFMNAHIDYRFLATGVLAEYANIGVFFNNPKLYRVILDMRWESGTPDAVKQSVREILGGYELIVDISSYFPRPFVCVSEVMVSRSSNGARFDHRSAVMQQLGGRPAKFNCSACPHHGTNLGSVPYSEGVHGLTGVSVRGKVCPAHGLFVHEGGCEV